MVGKGGVTGIHHKITFNYPQKPIFNEAITFSSAHRRDKGYCTTKQLLGLDIHWNKEGAVCQK